MSDVWELPPEGWEDFPRRPPGPGVRAAEMGLAHGVEPPMTQEEYETAMARVARRAPGTPDPHRCMYNTSPRGVRMLLQCEVVIPDPRKLRYCMKHAMKLGYPVAPEDREAWTREEARIRLQGLSSRAVAALADVMEDEDAPAGVRAKAAESVLDRTGFHAKQDLSLRVEATVVDLTAIIRERLDAKRERLSGAGRVVEGEIVTDVTSEDEV
jgi:hypothetical protein